MIDYKDCELNLLDYKNALIYDKRTYCKYYSSLLFFNHIILFSFYPIDDYNIKIIKINLFFLSFDIFFSVNTFFFNDSTIHQIYKDKGAYNLSYFMPQIIYSFIISYFIMLLIKYSSLSQRNLIEVKNEDNIDKAKDKVTKTKRCLIIKYILFYIFSFIYLTLFWYYLSSFCAVYQNSQVYLIINTFISFGLYLLYPFIYNLLPCFIRIYSLKKNIKNVCIFKISKFLQIF